MRLYLISLTLLILSRRSEGTAQAPWDVRRPNRTAGVSPAVHFAGGDAAQRSQLEQALGDAALLASKGIPINFNMYAAMEFFGALGYIIGTSYERIIQDNFARAAPHSTDAGYVNLTCDDPAQRCGSPTTAAYNAESGAYPALAFCPLFFQQRSMAEAIRYAADPDGGGHRWDLRNYDHNQALIVLHHIMHINAVGQPPITDVNTTYHGGENRALGPKYWKYLGIENERDNVAQTIRNADTCAQYAMGDNRLVSSSC
ncbi:hypothetical protein B0H17DRAFT_1214361 [Mycena rosella]|uniref:Uncharacterized protein n=1 Tax=Mycena rosella TaxID=1033263 RepID=A0AAD7CNW1_MYCRO|nr:hypothetical protein B0H17DRAFT_1214361 [Mycena rosella]